MGKTKKPTGLSITRNGNKYAFKWKIASADHGAGQKLEYRIKGRDQWFEWNNISVNTTATSKAVTIDKSNFYPSNVIGDGYLTRVQFRVRGKRSPYTENNKTITPTVSDWAEETMTIKKPRKPVLTAGLGNSWDICTFNWSIEANDTDEYLYTSYEYQSIMVTNSNETDIVS